MAKKVKDRASNWDLNGNNERSLFNDDQDDYISERSSIPSMDGTSQAPNSNYNPNNNNNPNNNSNYDPNYNSNYNPDGHQDPYYVSGEGPHTLRYFYNELPEGGVPAAAKVKEEKKEQKKKVKEEREARRGQGTLVQGPDGMQPLSYDNYFPYWYYYKAKNPDWIMRQQPFQDGQFMPEVDPTKKIEPIDPAELPATPKLTAATRKARKYQYGGRETPDIRYNQQQQRYEMMGKDGLPIGGTGEDDDAGKSKSKQYIPLKDGENNERMMQNGRYSRSDPRGKLYTGDDWGDHYLQYMRNKSSLGFNAPVNYKPNIQERSRKKGGRNPFDEMYGSDPTLNGKGTNKNARNGRYRNNVVHDGPGGPGGPGDRSRRNNNNNSSAPYSKGQYYDPSDPNSRRQYNDPSNPYPKQPHNNRYGPGGNQHRSAPHNNQHGRHPYDYSKHHNISSNNPAGGNMKINNSTYRNDNKNSRFQNAQDSSIHFPPSIYNQNSMLPPLTQGYGGGSYSMGPYGSTILGYDSKHSLDIPKLYKSNAQTKFYDRYLGNVIDKRLFT